MVLAISSLDMGGASRVMAGIADFLVEQGHRVTLLVLSTAELFVPTDPRVNLVTIPLRASSGGNPLRAAVSNVNRIRTLRRALQNADPDVLLSFMDVTNILVLMASAGLPIPIIVSERNDPRLKGLSRSWGMLRARFYPRARAVVVQSPDLISFFNPNVQRLCTVIPNPCYLPEIAVTQSPRQKKFITLGRLHAQKRPDLFLDAAKQVLPDFPDWTAEMWGRGLLEEQLRARIAALGLSDRVFLRGATKETVAALASSEFLVQCSDVEGFPNSVLEAMACARPVVATDCGGAMRDLVIPDETGILVPRGDAAALAQAIRRMIEDTQLRERLGPRARQIAERYAAPRVLAEWEALLLKHARTR